VIGILFAAALLAAQPGHPAGASHRWITSGPCGGSIEAIAVDPHDPDVAYAAASNSEYATEHVGGVFKTTDGGQTWAPSLFGVPVYRIWIAPADSATVYAALFDRILRSQDGGASWDTILATSSPFTLGIDPTDANRIYATIDGVLWKSVDGGANWTIVEAISFLRVDDVAFDSGSPASLHAAVRGSSGFGSRTLVFERSHDGGLTWESSGSEFIDTYGVRLFADPVDADTVYAASGQGVLKTSDRGENWARTPGQPGFPVNTLTVDPSDHSTVYGAGGYDKTIQPTPPGGGLFVSHDGGTTWTRDEGLQISLHSVASGVTANGLRLYAGSMDFGVFRSEAGSTWAQVNDGIRAASSLSIALDPRDAKKVYALTTAGFARSMDGGQAWTVDRLAPTGVGGALAVSPTDSDVVFASGSHVGLVRSRDRGQTWETAFEPGSGSASIAFDANHPNVVYLASFWPLKSSDGGQTWHLLSSAIDLEGMALIAVDSQDSDVIYGVAAPHYATSFYRSPDGGTTWIEDALVSAFGHVTAVVPDPKFPGTVWVATDAGLLRSSDSGITWGSGGFTESVAAMTTDGATPQTLYVGTPDGRLFGSSDEGASWQQFEHFIFGLPIRALAADSSRGTIYVATEAGVYQAALGRPTRTLPPR
jgi:photosystem II stability/assembly factor-like uncharacterized protein